MALSKSIQSAQNGHVDTYWRVAAINSDALRGMATITLVGYRDQQWRDNGGAPNQERTYVARGADYAALANGAPVGGSTFAVMATAAYSYIVTAPRLVDGVQVASEFADAVAA